MSKEHAKHLQREIKEFINSTHSLINKSHAGDGVLNNAELSRFAEKIWDLNHFSTELLQNDNLNESLMYNARIVKDLTESPIYASNSENDACSLVSAADQLKHDDEFTPIKLIMKNLIKDDISSEVLFDDLMVIYKELAA